LLTCVKFHGKKIDNNYTLTHICLLPYIDEILDEQINFYANLFSTEGWDKNAAQELVTHMDRKLTCDESEDLEKDLTINEIKKISS
jgi:hypothetical protein